MTEPEEGFLRRWARRKAEVEAEREDLPEPTRKPAPAVEPESPAELPPVETLTAESDFTAFLKAEVPRALRQAALRKAWTANPVIAGHRPLVEYDWDLNAPGYGKLWDVDDAKKLVGTILGHLEDRPAAPPEPEAAAPPPDEAPAPEEGAQPDDAPAEDPHPTA